MQEKSDKDLYNEEREKRFIDHEIEIELEKNLRIALINGFFSKNLVSSQKTSDARCCQFLFLFHFFLPFLGGRRLELFI